MAKKLLLNLVFIFIASIPLLISNHFLFLKDPPIWPDEAVFADIAKNFSFTGNMYTNIYAGIVPELDKVSVGYPPLYFYILSYWTKLFGFEIESVRSLSYLLGLLSLCLFFLIAKIHVKNNFLAAVGTFILSLNVHFARSTRLARMEILTLLFFLISHYLFLHARNTTNKYIFLTSGLASAFATLTHPMGFISTITIFLGVVMERQKIKQKIINLVWVLIPIVLLNLIRLIIERDNFTSLVDAYLAHSKDKIVKIPYAFILFQADFSWYLLFISYLAIVIVHILLYIKVYKNGNPNNPKKETPIKDHMFIILGLVVSFVWVILGKEGGYMVYLQPFITLSLLYLINYAIKHTNQAIKIYIFSLASLIPLNYLNLQFFNNDNFGITRSGLNSIWDSKFYNYHNFTKKIVENIPKDKKISIFITSTPDPYFDLEQLDSLTLYETVGPGYNIADENYKKALDASDYVISTWVPHQFLVDYLNSNTAEKIFIGDPGEYQAILFKLKPRSDRIQLNSY